jgi:16S rRNA (guanine527-N7)-methyltransferase
MDDDDVSRETAPEPDPAVAASVFPPDRLGVLQDYADLLASEGVRRGLVGPREVPRLWDRHLVNCGLLSPLIPQGSRVADLGSGAGLPGLVLALARPDLEMTLVEPMLRRTTFLLEAVDLLGASNVSVLRTRAEQGSEGALFDVVTARALAPLDRLLDWGLPWVSEDGVLLAMKGSSAQDEVNSAERALMSAGAAADLLELSVPGASSTWVVRVVIGGRAGIDSPPPAALGGRRRRRDRR